MVLFMKGGLFQCDVCGKHFRRRENLGEHVVLFRKWVLLHVLCLRKVFQKKGVHRRTCGAVHVIFLGIFLGILKNFEQSYLLLSTLLSVFGF